MNVWHNRHLHLVLCTALRRINDWRHHIWTTMHISYPFRIEFRYITSVCIKGYTCTNGNTYFT
mgnify:CR=1 FL=1